MPACQSLNLDQSSLGLENMAFAIQLRNAIICLMYIRHVRKNSSNYWTVLLKENSSSKNSNNSSS